MANFVCFIKNISNSLNFNGEIMLESQEFYEAPSDNIAEIKIPDNTSAVILFKNEIAGRGSGGVAIVKDFNPTAIKQYVITTEPFLNLPTLLARYPISKPATDGVVGAYVLRDGTLFLMNDEMKATFEPIIISPSMQEGKASKEIVF